MTDRYANAKIYSIRSNQCKEYYIGSTCLKLPMRLYHHRRHYNQWLKDKHNYITSYEILKYEDAYIELIEEVKCNNKMELLKREGELIREHYNNIVNKARPNRTKEEYNKTARDWENKNKDVRKLYRDTHKEEFKKYREIHSKKKYKCEICNLEMLNNNKYKHNLSNSHINKTKNLTI